MVVAGGSGRRFGAAKQFAVLGGRPLVEWAVGAARSVADGVVLVLSGDGDGDTGTTSHRADRHPADGEVGDVGGGGHRADDHGADVVVAGGDTRSDSVRCGLAAVPTTAGVVVVHDAARPLASPALFRAVVDAVRAGADAVVPGVAVSDTIKMVDEDGIVTATVPRHRLVAVQTPQAFRAEVLRRAHETGGNATDDAALVEATGAVVHVVRGEESNLKITTAADLRVAAVLVEATVTP